MPLRRLRDVPEFVVKKFKRFIEPPRLRKFKDVSEFGLEQLKRFMCFCYDPLRKFKDVPEFGVKRSERFKSVPEVKGATTLNFQKPAANKRGRVIWNCLGEACEAQNLL
jgi:hypothetical protein